MVEGISAPSGIAVLAGFEHPLRVSQRIPDKDDVTILYAGIK
jgi:hypothetical protein